MTWDQFQQRGGKFVDAVIAFVSLRWVRSTWMYLVRFIERIVDDHIFLSAAGVAFNALICIVPLTLIIFYVLGLYLDSASAEQTIYAYIDSLNIFPVQQEQLKGIVDSFLEDFISGSGLAGIVGGVGLLYTASALFAAVRTIFDQIFHIRDTKNVVVSKLKDFALLSIVGIMLVIINIVLLVVAFLEGFGGDVVWLQSTLSHVVSISLPFIGFVIIFLFVPDKRLPWKAIFLASIVAAVMWAAARVGFEYYIKHFWRIGKIYGSYGIIVMMAIWIYYSSVTLLIAAEVGEMYIERTRLKRLFTFDALEETRRNMYTKDTAPDDDTPET